MSEKKRYIVEASEPQDGQEISSGGVRKNGKMVEMFQNPVPYVEQEQISSQTVKRVTNNCTNTVQTKSYRNANFPQRQRTPEAERLKSFAIDCLLDYASMFWDATKPLLRAKINAFISVKLSSVPSKTTATTNAEEVTKESKLKTVSREPNTADNVIPISRYRVS